MLAFLKRFPERVLEALQTVLLFAVYLVVAMPIGLLWRAFSPHGSWKPARDSRWETPDPGRDPSSLEQAEKQY